MLGYNISVIRTTKVIDTRKQCVVIITIQSTFVPDHMDDTRMFSTHKSKIQHSIYE
jgi:hypothetical protein